MQNYTKRIKTVIRFATVKRIKSKSRLASSLIKKNKFTIVFVRDLRAQKKVACIRVQKNNNRKKYILSHVITKVGENLEDTNKQEIKRFQLVITTR